MIAIANNAKVQPSRAWRSSLHSVEAAGHFVEHTARP
jgi:hypothetical protein